MPFNLEHAQTRRERRANNRARTKWYFDFFRREYGLDASTARRYAKIALHVAALVSPLIAIAYFTGMIPSSDTWSNSDT